MEMFFFILVIYVTSVLCHMCMPISMHFAQFAESLRDIIAPFIDIPMLNVKYLSIRTVQMHTGALSKLVYGFASIRAIISTINLVGYFRKLTHRSYI